MSIQKILLNFEPKKHNLLPAIKQVTKLQGIFGAAEAKKVAEYFNMNPAAVFSAASFYDEIVTAEQPGLVIQICDSSSCQHNSADQVIQELESLFQIKVEDYNPKVRIERISCLGRCLEGPVMVVNGTIYEKVTPEKVDDILRGYVDQRSG